MSPSAGLREFIQRVEEFQIDQPDKALNFVGRLARENNWSISFSERVVLEYKRFCILAMKAGHPVTPSEEVDQAWHLHLTYTRSYWNEFCPNILGKPLHHDPTAGGVAEGVKFRDWYQLTLDSYRKVFGAEPPRDIWPSVPQRFSHAGEWKWVNEGRSWIIPKRPILASLLATCSLAVLLFMAGCRPTELGMNLGDSILSLLIPPFSFTGPEFLVFYLLVALIGILMIVVLNNRNDLDDSDSINVNQMNLSTQQLAVLSGGGSRLTQCAVAELYGRGNLVIEKQTWGRPPKLKITGERPSASGVVQSIYDELSLKSKPQLGSATKSYYDQCVQQLQDMKLRHASSIKSKAGLIVAAIILLLGVARVLQGLATHHPVGILMAQMIAFGVLGLIFSMRFNMVTKAGKKVLQRYKQELENRTTATSAPAGRITPELLGAVALTGSLALIGIPELDLLKRSIDQHANATTGSDGGCGAGCGAGGCGGGGCGGGCGGCGS